MQHDEGFEYPHWSFLDLNQEHESFALLSRTPSNFEGTHDDES
jgi:hypothetical protein